MRRKIIVRKTNPQSEENKVLKREREREKKGRTTKLSPVSKDLNLGYPTWFSLLGWAVKNVMPFT